MVELAHASPAAEAVLCPALHAAAADSAPLPRPSEDFTLLWLGGLIARISREGEHEVGVNDEEGGEGERVGEEGLVLQEVVVAVQAQQEDSLDDEVDQQTGETGGLGV